MKYFSPAFPPHESTRASEAAAVRPTASGGSIIAGLVVAAVAATVLARVMQLPSAL
jgi:hypothetical protein